MKFLCTQDNLLIGLSRVVHISGRNTTLPILNNILLKTTKAGLELAATNLEVAITTTVRGKTEQEGDITIQGRLLLDWVSLTPAEKIELEVVDNNLIIAAGKRRATIRGVPTDDFPVIPEVLSGIKFITPGSNLINALNCISLSVKEDEGRPEISGILWQIKNSQLFLVGTDSYRLAEAQIKVTEGKDTQLIVPLKTTQELVRVVDNKEGDVQVLVNDNQILFSLDDTKIISRLVSGQYPDYQQIVPQQFITKLIIEKDELIQAVKAASLFVRTGINDIKLNYLDNNITISSTNAQIGENSTEITPVKSEGEGVEIVFNYHYFLDGLQSITTNRVVLGLNNSNSPAIIKPLDLTDFYYIIMPIRQ